MTAHQSQKTDKAEDKANPVRSQSMTLTLKTRHAMRVSDERYNGMIADYRSLAEKCDKVETLAEFVEKYGDELEIENSNIEDGFIHVEICGDLYTINESEFGLNVSQDVEITDPVFRAPVDIYLETEDIYA